MQHSPLMGTREISISMILAALTNYKLYLVSKLLFFWGGGGGGGAINAGFPLKVDRVVKNTLRGPNSFDEQH